MRKLLILFLWLVTFNVMSSQCEELFESEDFNAIFNVCYGEAANTSMTDQGEITGLVDGSPEVQYILGNLFEYGYGIEKNDWAAIYWYTKAADKGHAKAQYQLGNLYNTSDSQFSVPWDLGLAQYYLGLACKNGISDACPDYESLLQL
ncbi:tetratricopeptide repeat protein [Orbus mooreae]|uniref:tetratricopeptide repeat protein n=1 Tax=Orbus mooreae TaxID=3074107 RepID=UPI00370D5CD6